MRTLGRLIATLWMSLIAAGSPALADACDPNGLTNEPIFSVRTWHAEKPILMGVRIQNHFPDIIAIVVSIEGKLEKYDQLLLLADSTGRDAEQLKSFAPKDIVTLSLPQLDGDFAHRFEEPADRSAAIVVRLVPESGPVIRYQACEVESSATLTVNSPVEPDPSKQPLICHCVRLECTGAHPCHREQECCGGLGACTCCSGGTCLIDCPPCDMYP